MFQILKTSLDTILTNVLQVTLLKQGGWTRWPPVVPFRVNHSVLLWDGGNGTARGAMMSCNIVSHHSALHPWMQLCGRLSLFIQLLMQSFLIPLLPLSQNSSDSTLKAGQWRFWKVVELMQWKGVSNQKLHWVRRTWNYTCISLHSSDQPTHQLVSQFPHNFPHQSSYIDTFSLTSEMQTYYHLPPPPTGWQYKFNTWSIVLNYTPSFANVHSLPFESDLAICCFWVVSTTWSNKNH